MKQSTIHWREISMRAKEQNLPDNKTPCLVMKPGEKLVTATFFTRNTFGREVKPYFLTGNDFIKPVTGMLWAPVEEVLRNGAT